MSLQSSLKMVLLLVASCSVSLACCKSGKDTQGHEWKGCHALQDTVNQAGLMFLPMETASAMVQAEATRVDTTSSALLFGSLPGSDLPFPQQLQVRARLSPHTLLPFMLDPYFACHANNACALKRAYGIWHARV